MNEYFDGKKLYGDDFTYDEIKKWYEEEAEGYADLGNTDKNSYSYGYHMVNQVHGFDKLGNKNFESAMGFGSAWGEEFEPIIHRIKELTIIEPSDNMVNNKIGDLKPKYVKPEISGKLVFEDNTFDLITCFGALHHVPNVSYVVSEFIRVLKPGGYLLFREPIVSMGDWRLPRKGLTKNERGIPVAIFDKELSKHNVEIVSREYCFTAVSMMQRTFGSLFKKPIYSYKFYILVDKYISKLLKFNTRYFTNNNLRKISPDSIYFVVKKL